MAVVSEKGPRSLQFGIFEVDLHAEELRRNGSKVKLQGQPFQIYSQGQHSPFEQTGLPPKQVNLVPLDYVAVICASQPLWSGRIIRILPGQVLG
jgi:hypothetical protein